MLSQMITDKECVLSIHLYVRSFKNFCKTCNREGGIIPAIFKFKVNLKAKLNKRLAEFEGCGSDESVRGKRQNNILYLISLKS